MDCLEWCGTCFELRDLPGNPGQFIPNTITSPDMGLPYRDIGLDTQPEVGRMGCCKVGFKM